MGRRATLNAKKRNRRIITISIVVAIIAAIVVLALIIQAAGTSSPLISKPVSSADLQALTGVSDSTLSTIGVPSGVTPPVAISGSPLTSGGKPEVLYIGGEFCPFCAIERWSMIVALSHFGQFAGLEYMQSSATDTNPNTPTFTFRDVTFTSQYITFLPVEEFGRGGTGDIRQTLTTDQQNLITQYDSCKASGSSGGIPFIDIANAYAVNCGAQFSLSQISGDNWTQVSSQLNTASSPTAQLIDGAANTLITAICKTDGQQPSSVCTQSYATVTLAYSTATGPAGLQSLALLTQVREETPWTSSTRHF